MKQINNKLDQTVILKINSLLQPFITSYNNNCDRLNIGIVADSNYSLFMLPHIESIIPESFDEVKISADSDKILVTAAFTKNGSVFHLISGFQENGDLVSFVQRLSKGRNRIYTKYVSEMNFMDGESFEKLKLLINQSL